MVVLWDFPTAGGMDVHQKSLLQPWEESPKDDG